MIALLEFRTPGAVRVDYSQTADPTPFTLAIGEHPTTVTVATDTAGLVAIADAIAAALKKRRDALVRERGRDTAEFMELTKRIRAELPNPETD